MDQTVVSYKLGTGKVITKIFIKDTSILHCVDGPAVFSDDTKEYYRQGARHRENGPAVLITKDNYIRAEWWIDGKLHRENKPAVIDSEGTVEYWKDGSQAHSS
jgi:hypothetical protein